MVVSCVVDARWFFFGQAFQGNRHARHERQAGQARRARKINDLPAGPRHKPLALGPVFHPCRTRQLAQPCDTCRTRSAAVQQRQWVNLHWRGQALGTESSAARSQTASKPSHVPAVLRLARPGNRSLRPGLLQPWARARPRGAAQLAPLHRFAPARSGPYQQLKGLDYVLLLADRHGVAVDFMGHEADAGDLRRAGLYLGAQWREDHSGTSAVGACLETGEALTVHQSDHFDFTHTGLSCTAAPIYDLRGELAAVLDLSLLRSPVERASQNLALNLVVAAARRVEQANLMAQSGQDWVVRLAQSPDFLDVDPDASISVDARGRIRAMTHAGARLLAAVAQLDWRQRQSLIGQPLARFFDLDLRDLPELRRHRPAQERLIRARDGSILFAHAMEPQGRTRRPPAKATPPQPPLPAALQALDKGDAALQALLRKAARLAPQELPILVQGETG